MKTFTKHVRVKGKLHSSFVFQDQAELDAWLITGYVVLCTKYGKLDYTTEDIHPLKIGDKCHVWGDGDAVYTIKELCNWYPHNYGFVLSHGWNESVSKCYPVED